MRKLVKFLPLVKVKFSFAAKVKFADGCASEKVAVGGGLGSRS